MAKTDPTNRARQTGFQKKEKKNNELGSVGCPIGLRLSLMCVD
jgi:hypothetical protein